MKFSFFKKIVEEKAEQLKGNAAYGGYNNDGGSANLLLKLANYQNKLVIEYDLRPSEFNKLDELDVGEPKEFNYIIEEYKISLAKKIKL